MAPKVKAKIVKDVTQLVLARRTRMCNFLEYKGVLLLSFVHSIWAVLRSLIGQIPRLFTEDTHLSFSSVGLGLQTMNW
jgi:hypothetical protein